MGDGIVRRQLRREIAVFGRGDSLRAEEVTCYFILTLRDGNKRLVCGREKGLLERVRQGFIESGGECSPIVESAIAKTGGAYKLPEYPLGFSHFDNAHDSKTRWLLERAVHNGKYQRF